MSAVLSRDETGHEMAPPVPDPHAAPGAADWAGCHHLLCIRLDNMGDVLMSTPAMRALRDGGRRRITLLASPSGAQLAPFVAEIDATVVHEAAWVKNGSRGHQGDLDAIARMRALGVDGAVIFTVYSQSALPAALLCHLAGIPRVLAYSRENPYRLISHWQRETEPESGTRHEVQRQLDLVAAIGARCDDVGLSFKVREIDRRGLHATLHAAGVTERSGWIAVHAGATASSRRYPGALLVEALTRLRGEGRRVLLLGGSEDPALAAALMRARALLPGLIDLSGQLSLGELGAALEGASVFICNNSGPAHIASALRVPVVDLYALTNPQHTPWQTPARVLNHDVPCKYCYRSVCPQGHHACLAGVAPARVAAAAHELLDLRRRAPRAAA
ncbi:glycosyltransferase family 9 protein [Bordetella genomosp. 5]|nr:glycosyltransferase family 9 protein [Bordetella genomosp. 5]